MARRTVSPQVIAREEDVLVTFLAQLNKGMLRRASIWQRALTPSGSRLRGIQILPDLWLGRDFQFYKLFPEQPRATQLSLTDTLWWVRGAVIERKVMRALVVVGIRLEVPSSSPVS